MYYQAIDKWNSGDSLAHYKYIKKIKIGPFTRYFYSMKDLQAYYNSKRLNYDKADERFINNLSPDTSKLRKWNDNKLFNTANREKRRDTDEVLESFDNRYQSFIHKNRKWNKRKALLDTGKLAVKSLFGFKSKSSAKKKYKKSAYVNQDPGVSYSNVYSRYKKHMGFD